MALGSLARVSILSWSCRSAPGRNDRDVTPARSDRTETPGVSSRSRTWRAPSAALLFVAAVATLPSVRWCSLSWDEIAPDLLLRCAVATAVGSPSCAMSFDGAPPPPAPRPACRWVGTVCGSDCAARGAGVPAVRSSPCPLANAHPTAPGGGHRRVPSNRHGRAFWIGDGVYTRALRSPDLRLERSLLAAGAVPAPSNLEPPQTRWAGRVFACAARSPARASNPPPPARAPPPDA
jgi:hypothetical protein